MTQHKADLLTFLSTYHAQEQMLELMKSKMNGIAVKRKPFANTERGRGIQTKQCNSCNNGIAVKRKPFANSKGGRGRQNIQ